jgi:hypothetical protein
LTENFPLHLYVEFWLVLKSSLLWKRILVQNVTCPLMDINELVNEIICFNKLELWQAYLCALAIHSLFEYFSHNFFYSQSGKFTYLNKSFLWISWKSWLFFLAWMSTCLAPAICLHYDRSTPETPLDINKRKVAGRKEKRNDNKMNYIANLLPLDGIFF